MILSRFLDLIPTCPLVWAIALSLAVPPSIFSQQDPQESVRKKIQAAERLLFEEGDFDRSIEILEALVKETGAGPKERQQAYELLAANYLAKTYVEKAEGALRKLLELVPNYKPDPERYSAAFVAAVEKVRLEIPKLIVTPADQIPIQKPAEKPPEIPPEEKAWYEKTWVWIAGGVVAVVVVVLILTKPPSEQPLPLPPSMPQSSRRTQ